MTSEIIVIGSANIDLIMQVPRLPAAGETITQGKFRQMLGGKGANQAVAAVRAGSSCSFLACLGDDAYAEQMLEAYQKDQLNTRFCVQEANTASGIAMINIDEQGENSISVAPGANFKLEPEHILAAKTYLAQAKMVLLQCEIKPSTLRYCIDLCHELGTSLMLNLAPAIPLETSYLSKLDYLVVNESEAAFLSHQEVSTVEEAQKAALRLREYVETVIITLGSKGAYIESEGHQSLVPAFRVAATDTTAAGDTFCGALASAICKGMDLEKAIEFASAAAAISVGRLGAQASIPKIEEIDNFLLEHSQ